MLCASKVINKIVDTLPKNMSNIGATSLACNSMVIIEKAGYKIARKYWIIIRKSYRHILAEILLLISTGQFKDT